MLRPEHKTKNEIAGFCLLKPGKPANSKRPASQKSSHYQWFRSFFTADDLTLSSASARCASSYSERGLSLRAHDTHLATSLKPAQESPTSSGPAALQRITYSVGQAATVTNLSRSKLYELMRDGALPSIKIGARRLIKHADLVNLLDRGI